MLAPYILAAFPAAILVASPPVPAAIAADGTGARSDSWPAGSSPQPPLARPSSVSAAAEIAEGDRLMGEKKYRAASFSYLDAAKADPGSEEALFKLGNCLAVLGYYVQAVERWNEVAQLTNSPLVQRMAQDNVARAEAKIAELSMTASAKAAPPPPSVDSVRTLARAAYEQGVSQVRDREFASAVQSLNRAIELDPGLAIAFAARGSAQVGLRHYSEAAADYESALRLDAGMASPLYGLGEALGAMGRDVAARQYYERYACSTAADVRPDLQHEARQKAEKLR